MEPNENVNEDLNLNEEEIANEEGLLDLYETIVLEGENGEELKIAIIEEIDYNDKVYLVTSVINEDGNLTINEEDEIEYLVFEKTATEGSEEEQLVQIEDADLINSVIGTMEAMDEEECSEENCEGCSGCDDDCDNDSCEGEDCEDEECDCSCHDNEDDELPL